MAIQGNPVTFPAGLTARLEALPVVPRRETFGDGSEPQSNGSNGKPPVPMGDPNQPAPYDENGVQPPKPTLENCDDKLAFQTVDLLVRSQDRIARNRWAIDLYHRAVDENYPFGRLLFYKQPNQSVWEYKTPPGASGRQNPAAVPNKANDLCNKITDTIEADPAKPDPVPPINSESADEAADLASEALRQLGSSTGIDDASLWRWSLRNALTAASSFIEYECTEDGGGWQPYQVLALPGAMDPSQPMVATDPMTGLALPAVDPVLRYVSPQNQFVPTADQADRVWLPGIRANKLRREQVRCFPPMVPAHQARAVAVLKWCTLEEALEMPGWDAVRQMTSAQLAQLASYRTPYPNMIVPPSFIGGIADGQSGPSMDQVGWLSPLLQRRMFYIRLYIKAGKYEYENGLMLDVSGANGGIILQRKTLDYTVDLPAKGGKVSRCRDIPVVQETPIDDIHGMDPMGWPLEARFAGSSEATATIIAAHLDAIQQRLRPHVIFRSTTNVDEDMWADRSTPIILDPTAAEPTYEQFPPLPDVEGPVQFLYQAQDAAASLGETAQGLETSTAVSGVAKNITVQQAKIGLSGVQQRHNGAKARAWKICLQLFQSEFSTAQLIRMSGEDGSAEERWWTGEDLAGIDEIGIEPGTGTMMTAEGKAQYISFAQQNQWMTAEDGGPIAMSGVSRDLGLPPDPVEQAIERAVAAWLDGPPDGWVQAYQQQQQTMQEFQQQAAQYQQTAQIAALQGVQPMTPPPQPPQLPPLPNPFTPKVTDQSPLVAAKWVKRLTKLIVSPQFSAQPAPWQQLATSFYSQEAKVVSDAQMAAQQAQAGQSAQQGAASPTFQQMEQKVAALVNASLASLAAREVTQQMGIAPPTPAADRSTGPAQAHQGGQAT